MCSEPLVRYICVFVCSQLLLKTITVHLHMHTQSMTSEVSDIQSEADEVKSVAPEETPGVTAVAAATAGQSQLAAGGSQLAAAQTGDANPSDIESSITLNSFAVVVESSQRVESQLAAAPAA